MFSRFTSDARRIVRCAENEARDFGSPAVEAEHLLLALTWTDEATMAAAGLDREAVALALQAERERSLTAVGISAADFDPPPRRIDGHPRMAASARLALERAVNAAAARKARRIVAGHILLGILQAEAGTVPRALAQAGVDRQELRERAAALVSSRTAGRA
jgi:ATP-dependent Clp protease ATP-binding subunit ClpA